MPKGGLDMDEQDKMLAESEIGREVINSTLSLDATHEAETEAINVQEKVGSETDKIEKEQ